MRPFKYLQANCVRCHSDVYDIKEEAPQVFEGRSLFANMGCANCHLVEKLPAEDVPANASDVRLIASNGQRKVGTDLRNINAKLSPAFINSWIWAPKAFRPSTKMPHFFMLENNSSDEEIKRTRQEARAITEYLVRTGTKYATSRPAGASATRPDGAGAGAATTKPDETIIFTAAPPKHVIPAGLKGSPEKGKILFTSLGCLGCHTNLNDSTTEKRSDGKLATLAEKWITDDLVKSGELGAKVERETGKTPDAKALKVEASKLYDSMSYNARQIYLTEHLAPTYAGEVRRYPDGTAKPVFQHHGPELSGVGQKLTTGRTVDQARQWLFDWVSEPRHYSEYTVMPQLRLNPQEAIDLAEYLLAQKRSNDRKDDPWKAELAEPDTKKLIELTSLFLRAKYTPQTALGAGG
jgi:cbb3-type cytochrome oxidase cytochrome c subunit